MNMTNMCQAFHSLPQPGGLLDQDSYHVTGMMLVLEVQAEKEKLDMEKERARASRH